MFWLIMLLCILMKKNPDAIWLLENAGLLSLSLLGGQENHSLCTSRVLTGYISFSFSLLLVCPRGVERQWVCPFCLVVCLGFHPVCLLVFISISVWRGGVACLCLFVQCYLYSTWIFVLVHLSLVFHPDSLSLLHVCLYDAGCLSLFDYLHFAGRLCCLLSASLHVCLHSASEIKSVERPCPTQKQQCDLFLLYMQVCSLTSLCV